MNNDLNILMLEDSTVDAEIIRRLLQKESFNLNINLCDSKECFEDALKTFSPDIILADNSIHNCSASDAMALAREFFPFIPFIMVTGTVSEEFAARIIKQGADDYILKDRLHRLPSAIENAVKQRAAERKTKIAQQKLVESEEKYRSLFHHIPIPIFVFDLETQMILDVNEAMIVNYDYSKEEFLKLHISSLLTKEDQKKLPKNISEVETGFRVLGTWKHLKKNGDAILVKITSDNFSYNGRSARMVVAEDVTERIKAEESLRELENELAHQKIQEQKRISRAIIKAQEKERNHIAQELHDNINQLLASIRMHLGILGKNDDITKKLVQYPIELLDSSIKEIRALCNKHVTPVKDIELKSMIEILLINLESASSIKPTLSYSLADDIIDDELKLNLYRIVQEQVNNVVKHSNAEQVKISISSVESSIEIMVEDNGKGFDVSNPRIGIGISNMINRVETFNGSINIDSAPGAGTRLFISVPKRIGHGKHVQS